MNPIVYVWIVLFPFVVVGCLKGRYGLSVAGMFLALGIPAILSATRLARKDSWWAKRFYDDEKRERSEQRYAGVTPFKASITL
jgi:hypothetical protein